MDEQREALYRRVTDCIHLDTEMSDALRTTLADMSFDEAEASVLKIEASRDASLKLRARVAALRKDGPS